MAKSCPGPVLDATVSASGPFTPTCADTPRDGQRGTWIVDDILEAYTAWHRLGRAHSVETWVGGRLVGGLYGVGIGRMVYGESMFAHRTDASKIALCALVCLCREFGIPWIDCQQNTGHLASIGAREVPVLRGLDLHIRAASRVATTSVGSAAQGSSRPDVRLAYDST